MARKSLYPRKCLDCLQTYNERTSYSRHIRSGACDKARWLKRLPKHTPIAPQENKTTVIIKNSTPVSSREEIKSLRQQLTLLEEKCEALQKFHEAPKSYPFLEADAIYIVRTRHALDARLSVYKIGFSTKVAKRALQYPKGSQLLFVIAIEGGQTTEAALHKDLRSETFESLKPRTDFGNEYYECDIKLLIQYVTDLVKKHDVAWA